MSMSQDKINILVVDDRPENHVAIEAVLEELGQNLVHAHSGREALRHVLNLELALILLDVNMPGMNGFETAEMIRQRKVSEHIPIIFITAFGDEMHASRGYSLGAVDYILTPVMPDVLRSKVVVFVDLFRKTQQIKRQAESLSQRATQLHKLSRASLAINAAMTRERLVELVTETARDLMGAHAACTVAAFDRAWPRALVSGSFSAQYGDQEPGEPGPAPDSLQALVCEHNRPVRLDRLELAAHPSPHRTLPRYGWLAVPLTSRDGHNLGLIEVSDKQDGEFSEDDEAILVQLAQVASIAIENTIFAEERETNRIKDEFLSTLSHELRTPLNAILGWTQLLRVRQSPSDLARGLDVIERNAKAQTKLIEDLLDVSRISSGKLRLSTRAVTLAPVIQAAIESVQPIAESKGVSIETDMPARGQRLMGDPDRLQQVVWNLLSNAVKFTPTGGHVHVAAIQVGTHLEIRVSDTGEGIHPGFLPYVFDRFRQADSTSTRSHGGLGIGLTIVRHIVEQHGGSVHAYSAGQKRGSVFTVKLPIPAVVDSSPAEQSGADNGPAASSDLTGVRILVVDDEKDAREVLAEMLMGLHAVVITAASAREARQLIEEVRPNVLISDIAMPEEDGYALIHAIRSLPPERGGRTPAIALTAYAREEDRARAIAAGFDAHLAKPVEPDELVGVVQECMSEARPAQRASG